MINYMRGDIWKQNVVDYFNVIWNSPG